MEHSRQEIIQSRQYFARSRHFFQGIFFQARQGIWENGPRQGSEMPQGSREASPRTTSLIVAVV